jgi:polyhydroxybutyrate depolymerase
MVKLLLVLAVGLTVAVLPAPANAAPPGGVINRPVPATGCGRRPPAPAGTSITKTVVSGGLERTYLLHLPGGYRPGRPTPLILSFHGRTRTSEYQEQCLSSW